jgi:hypothetical protein
MAVVQFVVVIRAIQIGRHRRDISGTVPAVVAFTQLDTRYLGNRVWLIGLFEWAGEQVFLFDRLKAITRINTAFTEKQHSLHPGVPCSMYDVCLHHQVLVDEFSSISIVGMDAPDFRSSQKDLFWLFMIEKLGNSRLVGEIELCMRASQQVQVAS